MPWRGPHDGNQYPTLGYEVGRWIEENCVIHDGIHQGDPYLLTDEMLLFLIRFYRLHPNAMPNPVGSSPFYYRGAQLMRPQKWGKSPFGATICAAQAFGPVMFMGWDDEGEPIGVPHPTPWVQIIATSEDQTDNIWIALYEMCRRGPIANYPGVDIGVMDINLPGGGKIEPATSSSNSRQGARCTYAAFDEPHLMTEQNRGLKVATTMKRNLGGMSGRWTEFTNAYDPSENSVAQRTQESPARDVFIDYRPPVTRPDLDDTEDALEHLRYVYGDSWWVDLNRVLQDARDPGVCPTTSDAMRYFFNRLEVGVSDAVDPLEWDARAREGGLKPHDAIAIGFHGSRSASCTSIVASRIKDGKWFHLNTWDPAKFPDHKIPKADVDQTVSNAFAAYDVRYLYGDPRDWQPYFDEWANRWPKRIVVFNTTVEQRMDAAIQRFLTVYAGDFTHDGNTVLSEHVKAAALTRGQKKRPRPEDDTSVAQHYLKIVKKRESGGHIDAFIAGILAEAARGQSVEKAPLAPQPTYVAVR